MLRYDAEGPIMLAGGSGVIGRVLAPMVARLDQHRLIIASRDVKHAALVIEAVLAAGGHASFLPFTIGSETDAAVSLVVGLVNDPTDFLLLQALGAGVPFVDVTRWTTRLALAMGRFALKRPPSPVVLASGWMGGLLARAAGCLASTVASPIAIEGAIRYALADASGPDSVDYMDRLWLPFEVPHAGGSRVVEPFRDRRRVTVDGRPTTVYRFDTPDQWTLPISLGAPADVRLGFDGAMAGPALSALVRLGAFRLLRSDRFRRLRHRVLRASGSERRAGSRSAFRVDVRFADGSVRSKTLVADGQARLTATGAWLAIRQALSSPPGVYLPEQDPDGDSLFSTRLPAAGITVLDEVRA